MSATRQRGRVVLRCLVAGLLVIGPASALGQGAAVLTGRILDTSGVPIAGARLRIPQLELAAAVDSTGRFRLERLAAGHLTVVAEAAGYFGSRAEIVNPASGVIEQSFTLRENAHVLAGVEVRARARERLPAKLQEFAYRQQRGTGRFLGPEQVARFDGQPLTE